MEDNLSTIKSSANSKLQRLEKGPRVVAVEPKVINVRARRLRVATERFKSAKVRWTRATLRVWKGDVSVEAQQEVAAALADLNAARRALAAMEARP